LVSLLVIRESGEQKLVSSAKRTIRIGRLSSCELLIDEPVVSRSHALLYRIDRRYFVQDTGSRNGTLVNGRRINRPTELSAGDMIGIGRSQIVFEPSAAESLLRKQEGIDLSATMALSPATVSQELLAGAAQIAEELVHNRTLETLLGSVLTHCLGKTSAERATIMLPDTGGELIPRAFLSRTTGDAPFTISWPIVNRALEQRQALLIREVADDRELQPSESIVNLKIRSAICAPLWNGAKKVGVLYADRTSPDRPFDETDRLFFSTLAGMLAEKIENAALAEIAREKHRLDAELKIAGDVQARLFPRELPEIAGFDLAAFNRPCTEVGGDYFDIVPCAAGYGIVIADVIGSGIGAAMLMANLQAVFRARKVDHADPTALVEGINGELLDRIGDDRFITLFYLVLDIATGAIRYTNAGHFGPMLLHSSGDISILAAEGIPLGILDTSRYQTTRAAIGPGEVLLLFSDGIVECADAGGELFGEKRLKRALRNSAADSADQIVAAVLAAMDDFRGDVPCEDDRTMVVLKRRRDSGA